MAGPRLVSAYIRAPIFKLVATMRLSTLFALLPLAAIAACRGASGEPSAPAAPAVTVSAAIERELNEWDEFTGHIEAAEHVDIRPRVTGYVQRVAFTEGSEVKKGDLLFQIDPRPYEADLARAEAQLAQAKTRSQLATSDLTRAQTLVAKQAISREEFDSRTSGQSESVAEIRVAEAAVTTARLNLDWTRVRAPISGRVSRAEVKLGNLVQAGPPDATLLTTIVSLDPVHVYFDGDEQTYLKYGMLTRGGARGGARDARGAVYVGLINETGYPHKGYIDFVDNQLDAGSGTIRVRAVFANKDRAFTPGLFARVKLVGSDRYKAVLVRDGAIGTDQDKKFVLVVKQDGTAEYRPVQLGRVVDGLRIVRDGLKPGERIVVNGLQRVRPGIKVAPKDEPMVPDSTAKPAAPAPAPAAKR